MPPITTNARRLAAQVVQKILKSSEFSQHILSKALDDSDLAPRDKGFCTELVYGTLRWSVPLEHSIRRALDKPHQKIDKDVLPHLLVAAYQLQHLSDSIPTHAVVNEAVNEVKRVRRYAAGFCNVVLKRLGSALHLSLNPVQVTSEQLQLAFGLPSVLVDVITYQLPQTEWYAACAAMNERPSTWIRSYSPLLQTDNLTPHDFVPNAFSLNKGGSITIIPGFMEGYFTVQDPASQIAALLVAPTPSSFVIDMCAAPGSKSLILKASGARVLAVDIDKERTQQIQENAKRIQLDIEIEVNDARQLNYENQADFALLDAPCSGLGTLRRHPEIKLRRSDDDINQLIKLQSELLDSAAKLLKPGGVLVYSVCSPIASEGTEQVANFLQRHPNFKHCDARDTLPWLPVDAVNPNGEIQLWPHKHACDAFFAARLHRL